MEAILTFDYTVLRWIADHLVSDGLTILMRFVTSLGDAGMIWLLLALLCMLRPSTRRCGWSMLGALALSLLIGNFTLKPLVHRPRPFVQYADLLPLIPPPGEFSFPSCHTSASFAAATALFLHHRRAGTAALILAALIGFSRLYVCVHFPTDVLAGALLGVALGALASWGMNELLDRVHYAKFK